MATELHNYMFSTILDIELSTGNFIAKKTKIFKYWDFSLHLFVAFQIPVAGGVSGYEAVALYKGRRKIASKGDVSTEWRVHQLILYCACGIMAGVLGGLLGLGGGFVLGPLFLELGIPPQVYNAFMKVLLEILFEQLLLCIHSRTNFLRSSMQVSSATATFAMTFSASISVVEYYLLKRFPVPYGNLTNKLYNFFPKL